MGFIFVGQIAKEIFRTGIRVGIRYGGVKVFEQAYKSGGYGKRFGRKVYQGYIGGTTIGSVGAGLRDAFLSSTVQEQDPSEERQTRNRMDQSSTRRRYTSKRYTPYGRRCWVKRNSY